MDRQTQRRTDGDRQTDRQTDKQILEAVLVVDKFPDIDGRLSSVASETLWITHKIIELSVGRLHIYTQQLEPQHQLSLLLTRS